MINPSSVFGRQRTPLDICLDRISVEVTNEQFAAGDYTLLQQIIAEALYAERARVLRGDPSWGTVAIMENEIVKVQLATSAKTGGGVESRHANLAGTCE